MQDEPNKLEWPGIKKDSKKGKYVVLEGPDLVGKTSIATRLQKWLKSNDVESIVAPQPGATELGQKIRSIVKRDKDIKLGRETEAMMFVLDHMSFVECVLSDNLDNGVWVISDRHNYISALVYQVLCGVDPDRLRTFYSIFSRTPKVDSLLIFRASVDELIERAKKRNDTRWDRYESDSSFANKVITAYNNITEVHGNRILDILNTNSPLPHPVCRYIDAGGSMDEVFDRVKGVFETP